MNIIHYMFFNYHLFNFVKVVARIAIANPVKGCETLINPGVVKEKIVLVERGDCMFIEKVSLITYINFILLLFFLSYNWFCL